MIAEKRSGFTVGGFRRTAFYVAVVAALGFFGFMLREMLPLVVTAWYSDIGPHRLHDLNFLALVWLALLGLVSQLHRPDARVTAVALPVLVMAPVAALALTTGSPIAMLPVLFAVVGLVVAALHPGGRSLLRIERVEPVDRALVGLLVVAAVPLLAYAADQLVKQYTVAADHAVLVHYGAMAVVAVLLLLLGTLAAVRERDWRFAGWAAALLAVYLGASSVAFPGLESSAGPTWGGLAVAWGIGFVAAVEVSRRDRPVVIEESVKLEAAPETVWDVLNDFDRMTDWVAFADELTHLSAGPVGVGTVYRETGGIGPARTESEWRIVEFDPPRRQVHVGDLGIMTPELTMEVEPVDGGTRFTQSIEFRALPSMRPVGWLLETLVIRRAMRSGLQDTQRDFKRLVEAED